MKFDLIRSEGMERHIFEGDGFECSICHRPRAMHLNDGFKPKYPPGSLFEPHVVSFDPKAHYGKHPYFWKPKSIILNPEEQARVDAIFSRKRISPASAKSPDRLERSRLRPTPPDNNTTKMVQGHGGTEMPGKSPTAPQAQARPPRCSTSPGLTH